MVKRRNDTQKDEQTDEWSEQTPNGRDEVVAQRAGGSESSVPTAPSAMDMAEKAYWRRRTLSTVTPASSPDTRRVASLAVAPAGHPAVPH